MLAIISPPKTYPSLAKNTIKLIFNIKVTFLSGAIFATNGDIFVKVGDFFVQVGDVFVTG